MINYLPSETFNVEEIERFCNEIFIRSVRLNKNDLN